MSDSPFLRRQRGNKTEHGRKAEKSVAAQLRAKLTPASGALDSAKGDMVMPSSNGTRFRIESKATERDSMAVKLDWLLKIREEALATGCEPALAISFVQGSGAARDGGQWVAIPLRLFKEVFGEDT